MNPSWLDLLELSSVEFARWICTWNLKFLSGSVWSWASDGFCVVLVVATVHLSFPCSKGPPE
jgi:hypothetical protein